MSEFAGLTLFRTKYSNPELSYQWFVYISGYMDNTIQYQSTNESFHSDSDRNGICRKYHLHECLFRQASNFFEKYYDFMCSRRFGLNRHTLILVTIVSNAFSVCRVRALNRMTSNYIISCRRRTDDTRQVLLIITVECLFASLNSWFSYIIISVVYCKGTLLADDDCPGY